MALSFFMGGLAYSQTGSIGDFVWHDLDADGIQDGGETGLEGVTVKLYTSGGVFITQMNTDSDGEYLFSSLANAFYRVDFVTLPGYYISPKDVGGDDTKDSDPATVSGSTLVQVSGGAAVTKNDCGMYQKGTATGHLYQDVNNNGTQDIGEPDLNNVQVTVQDKNSISSSTFTDVNGDWTLNNIEPGNATYDVIEIGPYFNLGFEQNEGVGSALVIPEGGSVDAGPDGYFLKAGVSGFVWHDVDMDGIQDPGETGVPAADVYLFDSGDNFIDYITTDVNGLYQFFDLDPGTFYVVFSEPAGYQFSAADQGGDDTKDSDANIGDGKTPNFALTSGNEDNTIDCALHLHGSISNFVWWDIDDDGVQDAGEPGVAGITVTLYESDGTTVINTDVTDASGEYSFTFLEPATYVIGFGTIAGYAIGQQDLGGDDTKDSDPNAGTGKTASIVISEGEFDTSVDCALIGTGQIGEGLVWEDTDGDDVQDITESGIDGATVELLSVPAEAVLKTTTTAGGGKYKFEKLAPANYKVKFTKPAGFDDYSTKDIGGDDAKDSDGDGADGGKTGSFSLAAGATDDSRDCGFYKNVNMSGKVWHDLNANGRRNGGESGENGVIVRLRNHDGSVELATTTSAGDGDWTFSGKKPGKYRVKFDKSTGSHFYSPKDVAPDDDDDSDADDISGETDQFQVNSGTTKNDLKCGQFLKASIGDFVWIDTDLDGIQDGGETGLGAATVKLYASDGTTLLDTDVTDGAGAYGFTDLTPGLSYIVQFDKPAGYSITLKDQGGNDAVDSDGDPGTTRTALIPLTSGQTDNTQDCGMYALGSIASKVWVDTDGDGIQDGGETGLIDVTVQLYESDGTTLITSTVTALGGLYQFDNLEPETYVVKFVPGPNFITLQDQGGDDDLDSDAHPTTGKTAGVVVASGADITNIDCGMFLTASVGNFVWYDTDNDGIQDGGELGMVGVTVNLLASDGTTLVTTTSTIAGGAYSFLNVNPGSYVIEFVAPGGHSFSPQDQGGDDALDSDANPGDGKTALFALTSGQTNNDMDAGLGEKAVISNFVWNDLNADGIQDGGETGINGVTVTLYQADGTTVITTALTAGGGLYAFTNLNPGTYVVGFTLPGGFFFSAQDLGGDDTKDSDANTGTGKTATVSVIAGETNDDIDAGMFDKVDLGDLVWEDTNHDGIKDIGESGKDGVTVTLYASDGTTVLGTDITAGGGVYGFPDLTPGTYVVGFTKPSQYAISAPDQGGDDTKDSDANAGTGKTGSIVLTSGNNNITVDCAVYPILVDLEVTKIVDDPAPDLDVDDVVTFSITIENLSSTPGTGIVLGDLLNAVKFTYQSHIATQGTYDDGTGVWTVGTIAGSGTATLTIDAKVLVTGVASNTATITGTDQTDPVPGNNSDMASLNATSSGGGGGGIESNGDLSSYIALRKFMRIKENTTKLLDQPENLPVFGENLAKGGVIVPSSNLKGGASNILNYLPESGPVNSKAHISTPTDLLTMSNAIEVFSADYFTAEQKRMGVIMAMTTPAGEVYNHTKVICDRLSGGTLENVRFVDIRGHRFILSLISQENGEMDYTVSFVAYENGNRFSIDNQWSKEWYKPTGNANVFNYQVWTISRESTIQLVEEILNRMDQDHDLTILNDGSQRMPTVYIKNGEYSNGNLSLTVANLTGASEVTIKGTYTRTEQSAKEKMPDIILPLNKQLREQVISVPVGHLFDMGFTLANDTDTGLDELYFADGAWGRMAEDGGGIIEIFAVEPYSISAGEGEYLLERDAEIAGSVKTYVSLFRNLTTRKEPVDLSAYNQMVFEASGIGTVEIVLVKDGIPVWSNQFRKTISLTATPTNYQIGYGELTSLMGGAFSAEDMVTVVFNAIGNQTSNSPFEMNIRNLKFNKLGSDIDPGDTNFSISAYPNPFTRAATFNFNIYDAGQVRISLLDITGREVDVLADRSFTKGEHQIYYENRTLKAGSYFCRILFNGGTEVVKISVIE